MKRILLVLLLLSSLVSNAQMEKYCLSLDAINDTLIAVSSQYDSVLKREYLIINPIKKKIHYKFISENEVCFIGSKIISYKNQYDDIANAPSSIFYSYDIYTKELKQEKFPFTLEFIKVSSKDYKRMFLSAIDKNEHFTIYLDENLILSDKSILTINCSSVFGNNVDTVACTGNFDYDKVYFKNIHPSITTNDSVQIIYFDRDFVVCSSMTDNDVLIYYNNNTGKVIKKENLKTHDIKKLNSTYWFLGKNKNVFYSKNLLDKPKQIKWADLNSSQVKELFIQ